jgi:hypothetical protein
MSSSSAGTSWYRGGRSGPGWASVWFGSGRGWSAIPLPWSRAGPMPAPSSDRAPAGRPAARDDLVLRGARRPGRRSSPSDRSACQGGVLPTLVPQPASDLRRRRRLAQLRVDADPERMGDGMQCLGLAGRTAGSAGQARSREKSCFLVTASFPRERCAQSAALPRSSRASTCTARTATFRAPSASRPRTARTPRRSSRATLERRSDGSRAATLVHSRRRSSVG